MPTLSEKSRGIVFDLDGTLVDSLAATFEAFNAAIMHFGGRRHTGEEIMRYFGPGEGEIFAKIIGAENSSAAYAMAKQWLDSNLDRVPLHSGVAELLEKLKSAGVPIAIFTGRSWDTTEIILRHHRLLDRFVTVVANDHVAQPKPSPEGLRLALQRMNIEPSKALMVGDSPMDIRAAHLAGANAVAALWDLMANRGQLEPHSPHHWAERAEQVWEIWTQA